MSAMLSAMSVLPYVSERNRPSLICDSRSAMMPRDRITP